MDFRKLKDLLKGSPDYQPNMGDVKQADRSVGLGVRPQMVRGYGEDQDTMDSLRDNARLQAQLGMGASEPNEADLEKQKMIEGMASGAMGSIGKVPGAFKNIPNAAHGDIIQEVFAKLKDANKSEQAKKLMQMLENKGFKVSPSELGTTAIRPDAVQGFGKVIRK